MPKLAELIDACNSWYPQSSAESWDAVGLTCGDPATEVEQVLLAVDCVPVTVAEAISDRAGLLITHHPLLLSGVHSVAADRPKGALVHRMITGSVAHFVAHTNADVASTGVSQALADLLGLLDCRPLSADPAPGLDHLTVFVPPTGTDRLRSALAEAGAGQIGNYADCGFVVAGSGQFRPLPGADPAEGAVGQLHQAGEDRLSMVLARHRRSAVLAAMRANHPYEEVAFELTEQPMLPADTGSGRYGRLPEPMSLRRFAELAADRLPRTAGGLRVSGDPDQQVSTVAVCGGSGASYTELARQVGADAYLTADLKHHSTLEAVAERAGLPEPPMALIDVAHWASEAPWLPVLAELLRVEFGAGLRVRVSELVTDPWTLRMP